MIRRRRRRRRGSCHEIGQDVPQKIQDVSIDLFKLEQEGVVTFGAVDGAQSRLRDARREFLLFGKGEETVGFDADDERWLLDHGERRRDRRRRGRVDTLPRHVVRVEFARDGDVAVAVEALDELLALIAQVRLCRKVGRYALAFIEERHGGGRCGWVW